MLTYEQLLHFSEKGWVLLEDVFNQPQVDAFKAGLDRAAKMRRPLPTTTWTDEITILDNVVMYDDVFLEWLTVPQLLEANRQLMGCEIRFQSVFTHIKKPHKDRHTRAEGLADPERWGWHRDFRPKWGVFPDDNDPRLINASYLNNVTYLTDVWPGNGSTAFLSGSHRFEGDYKTLKNRCTVEVPPVKAGSVVIFTESLIHAAVPILSETIRYNMYNCFTPPWFRCWRLMDMPQPMIDSLASDELRKMFDNETFTGQHPVY